MEHAVFVKTLATSIGVLLSSVVLWMFQVPPEAYLAGFICAVIGEFARSTTSFKSAVLTIISVSILTGYFGKIFIDVFHTTSPTSVCAVLGFVCSFYRDYVLVKGKEIIDSVVEAITAFFKRGRS